MDDVLVREGEVEIPGPPVAPWLPVPVLAGGIVAAALLKGVLPPSVEARHPNMMAWLLLLLALGAVVAVFLGLRRARTILYASGRIVQHGLRERVLAGDGELEALEIRVRQPPLDASGAGAPPLLQLLAVPGNGREILLVSTHDPLIVETVSQEASRMMDVPLRDPRPDSGPRIPMAVPSFGAFHDILPDEEPAEVPVFMQEGSERGRRSTMRGGLVGGVARFQLESDLPLEVDPRPMVFALAGGFALAAAGALGAVGWVLWERGGREAPVVLGFLAVLFGIVAAPLGWLAHRHRFKSRTWNITVTPEVVDIRPPGVPGRQIPVDQVQGFRITPMEWGHLYCLGIQAGDTLFAMEGFSRATLEDLEQALRQSLVAGRVHGGRSSDPAFS